MNSASPDEQIKAAVTLARSSAVAMVFRWALMIGVPVLTSVGGWIAAKIDTREDIVALRLSVDRLTTQQRETLDRLDAAVPAINAQIDGVQRDVVVVGGAALAYESERRAKDKLAAGDELAKAYDAMRRRGETPASSASVLRTVAVPHSGR